MFHRQVTPLVIPVHTAYITPDPYGLEIRENQPTALTNPAQTLTWFGKLSKGVCEIKLRVIPAPGSESKLTFVVNGQRQEVRIPASTDGKAVDIACRAFASKREQFVSFALSSSGGGPTSGKRSAPQVVALILSGPATAGAHFNYKERRNCASIHLGYPTTRDQQVAGFYNECTPETDPIHTYYEVCGWHRGYFGMQVNSPTERRIIFSVWDAGEEAVDRNKVGSENRVTLLAKGPGVVADSFGNEGTGGHSHLVYNWKLGDTFRFYMTAEVSGKFTTYTGWFYFPDRREWGLIARFRAPKDGQYMRGLYSFNENFGGETGQLKRRCRFGPAWVHDAAGSWTNLNTIKFTCDATGSAGDRIDFDGLIDSRGRFFLENGGFSNWGHVKPGQTATAPLLTGAHPDVNLPDIKPFLTRQGR